MSETKKFDVCVIGAGPGGYVAAIRAAQLGLKVGIVEANHLGGICLNWGCIPTKALLKSSEVNHLLSHVGDYGFEVKGATFDFDKVIKRSRDVSKKLSSGIAGLLKKNKVEVIDGYARFISNKEISIEKDKKEVANVQAADFIIATGARARVIPGMEPDGDKIWTYREAMTPKSMPKSLVVVGSGAIGSEFASFYNNMGCEVTLVEMADNILPVEDEEISKIAAKSFTSRGIKIVTGAALKAISKSKTGIEAEVEVKGKKEKLKAEKIILAVGVVPNIEDIGLDKTKIKTDRGLIQVSGYLETSESNIYAIGDVISGPWLAHKASHEGIIAAEKIASKSGKYDPIKIHPIKKENIPGCTYSMPQIASVGLTEAKAKAVGKQIKVGRFPYMANGKAIASGETEGLIKIIFDEKTGELLGAHLVGAEVTEMIQGFVIAKQAELTEEDLMHTIFPHPTMSEMMHEAVLDAYGKAIHF
ncbi:MAG: dihydrolipoyl dehydrogenase [Rickettsiales bacterium]|nr:dihydrolipoyl dehydrogenase [Rickettsiales bacterium]